jgi:hypothetical protein
MNRTQIYLTEAQAAALDARAKAIGRTRSDLIREAIDVYLAAPVPKTGAALLAALEKIGPLRLEGFEDRQKVWRADLEERAKRTAKALREPVGSRPRRK